MDIVDIVDRFYTPPLCLFGAIGNCLSVYVFCMTSGHRNLSSSYYLSALAISDIGFLINLFAVWLTGEGYEVITTRVSCPFVMYLGQVTCFLSVWFIVAFTCERFCAVCYPLTRPSVCTVARAKKVIGGITIVALLVFSYVWVIATIIPIQLNSSGSGEDDAYSVSVEGDGYSSTSSYPMVGGSNPPPHVLPHLHVSPGESGTNISNTFGMNGTTWLHNGGKHNNSRTYASLDENDTEVRWVCSVPPEYLEFSMLANHVDSFFTLILPFCAITFLNVRITLCVWKLKDQRETIIAVRNINRSASQPQIIISSHPKSTLSNLHPSLSKMSTHDFLKIDEVSGDMGESRHIPSQPRQNRPSAPTSSMAEVRVTKTLLLVSTVFLVLNLPAHAIRAIVFLQHVLGSETPVMDGGSYLPIFQQWANILFNTNFSVNFLLYCVSGRNFRKSLRTLCFPNQHPFVTNIGTMEGTSRSHFKGKFRIPTKAKKHITSNQNGLHHTSNLGNRFSQGTAENSELICQGRLQQKRHQPRGKGNPEMSFYISTPTEMETFASLDEDE